MAMFKTVKVFADGADFESICSLAQNDLVRGFTTNPSLARKAGVTDYESFARAVLDAVTDRPISFEVFADEIGEMRAQARAIAGWGANANVKIPITNTKGVATAPLVAELTGEGITVNVTAMFTRAHVRAVLDAVESDASLILSVFAGRIADVGQDPVPVMADVVKMAAEFPRAEVLWASTREAFNAVQADEAGCHIITMPPDLIAKLKNFGKDLDQCSLETVKTFHDDARSAGFAIDVGAGAGAVRAAS